MPPEILIKRVYLRNKKTTFSTITQEAVAWTGESNPSICERFGVQQHFFQWAGICRITFGPKKGPLEILMKNGDIHLLKSNQQSSFLLDFDDVVKTSLIVRNRPHKTP